MTIETLRHFFGWCAVINYLMLLFWAFLYLAAYAPIKNLTQRWFKISDETFDSSNYRGMVYFKIAIWTFNITPYLALWMIG